MPNHFHLLMPFKSSASENHHRRIINGLTGSLSRKLKEPGLWQHQNPPSPISDRHHLRRTIRYVALNPCRKNLCKDPLEWPWSTYRDLFGSTVDPWTTAARIAHTLGENERGFESRIHLYVTSDPSVSLVGTPMPKASQSTTLAQEGILEILNAASAALHVQPPKIKSEGQLRSLFIHLACRQGWKNTSLLAELCGITPRAVRFILSKAPSEGLGAAAFCLGDQRLRELPESLR